MKVKIFSLSEEDKVNEFIQSVVLLDEGAVQVTSEGRIVVFYRSSKDDYESVFVEHMIDNLKRNLFHENIRKASMDSEVETFKAIGGKSEVFDRAIKNQKEANDNIKMFEAKIAALKSWTAKNILKT